MKTILESLAIFCWSLSDSIVKLGYRLSYSFEYLGRKLWLKSEGL